MYSFDISFQGAVNSCPAHANSSPSHDCVLAHCLRETLFRACSLIVCVTLHATLRYISQATTHFLQVARTRVACGQSGGSGPFYASFSSVYAIVNSGVMIQTALTWHSVFETRRAEKREFEIEKTHPHTTQLALTVTKDVIAALIVFPVDVVRRHMMLAPAETPCVLADWSTFFSRANCRVLLDLRGASTACP